MRHWAVVVLSITLASAADNTLYDDLKTVSSIPYEQSKSSPQQVPIFSDYNVSYTV